MKNCIIGIILVLASFLGASALDKCHKALSDELVPIIEIVSVSISDKGSGVLQKLLPDKSNVYISFSHRGKTKGKTITFDDRDETYANLPLDASDGSLPVLCTIKQKRKLWKFSLPEKVLFKASFALEDDVVDEATEMGFIETSIVDRKSGKDVGLVLQINTFSTEWEAQYVNIHDHHDGCPCDRSWNKKGKKDLYFRLFLRLLQGQVKAMNLGGAEILTSPTQEADENLPTKNFFPLDNSSEYLIVVPAEDEFLPLPLTAKYGIPAMNKVLPNRERNNILKDRAHAQNEVRHILGEFNTSPSEGRWVRPVSDESMTRVFFSSMGGYFLEHDPDTGGYKADMTFLNSLDHKEGLENLGCRVFFDSNGAITMIEDGDEAKTIYTPESDIFEWAKLKARSAAFTYASLMHITNFHFTWASTPGMALRKFLPPSHPIRMALTGHFFRTHFTCTKAKDSLLDEKSVLGRSLPFQYDGGLKKAYYDLLQGFEFETYPDELKRRGVSNCTLYIGATDGLDLHKVMGDYASNMFDEIYGDDATIQSDGALEKLFYYLKEHMHIDDSTEFSMASMKLIVGEILFRVSGDHSMIGNAAPYGLEPHMVNFRLRHEDKGCAFASQETRAAVTGITGITMPAKYPKLGDDWSHLLSDPHSKAYNTLRRDLDELAEVIDVRNKVRKFVNRDFHPEVCALSIFS
jgi:hypothetical protein